MGLSSKQVSIDGLDWEQTLLRAGALELPKPPKAIQQQQQQQSSTPLKCPRCDSANTKFCYYNNYNKSQPRHFCKACRRHWTKGGTLRNVPVGGGRKNKRLKTCNNSGNNKNTINMAIQPQQQQQQQRQHLPHALGDQKNISEILYKTLLQPPSLLQPDCIKNNSNRDSSNYNSFLGSTASLPSIPNLPFTSLSSFDGDQAAPISAAFQSSNVYNYNGGTETAQNSTVTTSTTNTMTPLWQMPTTNSFMDSMSYWSWDDLATFMSTELKQPWDDSQNKLPQ
ncbi:hypothetical protein HHK36_001912 [Tetracentron sinense]|uniref:Dof zinc finger protein n=1 Tax=Tetracentron sinense TaxID=13715 RepID=A0A835A3J9_TETSI|nr:hypothetical protein HHK36_001912 [Tetracentron sinense]